MSKERRRKQFERAVAKVYIESGQRVAGNEAGGDWNLGMLVNRLAAGNSAINVTIPDNSDDFAGLLALQRAFKKFGVTVTEVTSNPNDLLLD